MKTVSVETLLQLFPAYRGEYIVIKEDQRVKDIIKEVKDGHEAFKEYYDKIAPYFTDVSTEKVCENIYDFLKDNIAYVEESEDEQTTGLPTRYLTLQEGDCKHYASFAGGVLDALNRQGFNIDWFYRFASYKKDVETPYHVFVVVNDKKNELWIDPTPGSCFMTPVHFQDERVKKSSMALHRYIGALYTDDFSVDPDYSGKLSIPADNLVMDDYDPGTEEDPALTPDVMNAIQLLLNYQVLDDQGNFNSSQLYALQNQIPDDEYRQLLDAAYYVEEKSVVGGLFSTIWRGVKKATLAAPRIAYLGLVALNVFGLASKLAQATSTTDGANKVRNKWYALGGDWAKLRGAIASGQRKQRIFGTNNQIGAAAAAAPAWIATAAAIIAALAPIIKEILNAQKAANVPPVDGFDYSLAGTNNGENNVPPPKSSTDPIQWAKDHPLESAAIAFLAYMGLKKFKIIR